MLAALVGVFLLKKYRNTATTYFIWFLVCLALCDFLGGYTILIRKGGALNFLKGTLFEKNYWWSTLYWKIGAILFFSFYYYNILNTKDFKNPIKFLAIGFLLFSVVYIAINWQDFFTSFFPVISVLGTIIVFTCTLFYFIEILRSDKILTFYKSLNFYITAAIFMWWLIITPIVFYDNYLTYQVGVYKRDWDYIHLRQFIYLFSNISMYLTFTFALIFCKPETDNN